MLQKYLITITGIALLFLSSCVKEDFSHCPTEITIIYHLSDFTPKDGFSLRANPTSPATDAEKVIENLYLFLFSTSPEKTIKRYLESPTASGAGFEGATGNVKLYLSPAEAGTRDVYLVANCADLKTALDGVTTATQLETVLRENANPLTMTTPLLMLGERLGYNFNESDSHHILDKITLNHAVAKLQINISLKNPAHQSATQTDYGYKFLNFGTKTFVLPKPSEQANTAEHTDWQPFAAPYVTVATVDGTENGMVNSFILTAYINEYDATQTPASVQFRLPYNPVMPPPHFSDEIYTIQLPAAVERNTLYYYSNVYVH